MHAATDPAVVVIRLRSATMCRALSVLWATLWLLLALERFGALGLQAWRAPIDAAWTRHLLLQLGAACPEVFYLFALWGIRQALAELSRGALYSTTLTRMLERVGFMLAAGALAGVVLVPGVERLLGNGPGYWIAFDVAGLVLGALGLSLGILARVLSHAAGLQTELDEMF